MTPKEASNQMNDWLLSPSPLTAPIDWQAAAKEAAQRYYDTKAHAQRLADDIKYAVQFGDYDINPTIKKRLVAALADWEKAQ